MRASLALLSLDYNAEGRGGRLGQMYEVALGLYVTCACLFAVRFTREEAREVNKSLRLFQHQGQDVIAGHQLTQLVGHLHIPRHHTLRLAQRAGLAWSILRLQVRRA